MSVFLVLTVVFSVVFASCYKIAVRRNCNLHVVNVWVYVGSTATVLAYILIKRELSMNAGALLLGIVAGVLAFFSTLSFFHHMKRGQLSASWTVISLAVGIPVLASIFLWGEHPTMKQTIGMVLIVAALVLFGRHETSNGRSSFKVPRSGFSDSPPPPITPSPHLHVMSFLLLMIAFVLTGVLNTTNKALVEWNLSAYRELYMLAFYGTAMILGGAIITISRQGSSASDRSVGFIMGLAGALSMLCLLIALQYLPGIVVFPVRSLGNLTLTGFVSILAWKERLSRSQWLGIILSLIAIWLIY
ncbi:MAG TPA: EamA family transporter [Armatimonadota bacterium]|nr:EamA family transporter [Armatimonadota bacterium]